MVKDWLGCSEYGAVLNLHVYKVRLREIQALATTLLQGSLLAPWHM